MPILSKIATKVGSAIGEKVIAPRLREERKSIQQQFQPNNSQSGTTPTATPQTPNNNIAMSTGGIKAPPQAPPSASPPPPAVTPSPMSPANVTAAMSAPKTDALGQDMSALATLVNPKTGEKRVVRSGSPVAQQFFGQGFVLEGSQQQKNAVAQVEKEKLATSIPAPSRTIEQLQNDNRTQPAINPTPDAISQLRQAILQNLTQSESERVTAEQLGELISGANEAIAGVAGQGRGITADLVTGQQGAIRNVAAAEAQTLEQRLARKEAERRANLQQAQTLLGFEQADKQTQLAQDQANQQKLESLALEAAKQGATPEEIQGILASTDFGQALTGASQFLQAPDDPMAQLEFEKAQLENLKLQQEIAGGGSLTPLQELEYQSKLLDIEKKQQDLFGSPGLTQEENQKRQADALQAQEIISRVDGLLNDPGLKGAVGPYSSLIDITGKSKDFIAKLETFKTNLVLPNLDKLKGAMSDNDIKFIKDSAGALNRNMTEGAFIQSLNEIKQKQEHIYNKLQLPEELQIAYDDVRIASPNISPQAIMDALAEEIQSGGLGGSVDFTNDLSTSVKGLTNGQTTLGTIGNGSITGIDGSQYWKQGLDFQLNENGKTKGAMVKSPVSGTIVDVVYGHKNPNNSPLAENVGKSQNGGFGNQVKIRLDDGRELWVSHLDDVARVAKGDRINSGQVIGTQGNTGMTYGQTGVHLDLTMKKPDGTYYSAREVAAILGDQRIKNTRLA